MSSLWKSGSSDDWAAALDGYDDAMKATGNEKLQELDLWYTTELPGAVSARSPPHMTKEEVVKLVDWKLTKGKWRPRLLDFAKQADASAVQAATTEAFQHLQQHNSAKGSNTSSAKPTPQQAVSAALKRLCDLKGVGPATASAMLALVDASCPFMSDEALVAVLGSRDYTVPVYLRLLEGLQGKAVQLSQQGELQWSAVQLERCLWVEGQRGKPAKPAGAKAASDAAKAGGGAAAAKKGAGKRAGVASVGGSRARKAEPQPAGAGSKKQKG